MSGRPLLSLVDDMSADTTLAAGATRSRFYDPASLPRYVLLDAVEPYNPNLVGIEFVASSGRLKLGGGSGDHNLGRTSLYYPNAFSSVNMAVIQPAIVRVVDRLWIEQKNTAAVARFPRYRLFGFDAEDFSNFVPEIMGEFVDYWSGIAAATSTPQFAFILPHMRRIQIATWADQVHSLTIRWYIPNSSSGGGSGSFDQVLASGIAAGFYFEDRVTLSGSFSIFQTNQGGAPMQSTISVRASRL